MWRKVLPDDFSRGQSPAYLAKAPDERNLDMSLTSARTFDPSAMPQPFAIQGRDLLSGLVDEGLELGFEFGHFFPDVHQPLHFSLDLIFENGWRADNVGFCRSGGQRMSEPIRETLFPEWVFEPVAVLAVVGFVQ